MTKNDISSGNELHSFVQILVYVASTPQSLGKERRQEYYDYVTILSSSRNNVHREALRPDYRLTLPINLDAKKPMSEGTGISIRHREEHSQ